MAKKALIEIDEEFNKSQQINDTNEKVADIGFYDWKRYDRDGLGLPPVFIFRESEFNKSENIVMLLDKKIDDVKNHLGIENDEFICFRESKKEGLYRVTYQRKHIDMTPNDQPIINKIEVKAEDIDRELARGLTAIYSNERENDLSKAMKQMSNPLEDMFFGDLATKYKKKL